MWESFLRKMRVVVTDETLRTRILFVLAAIPIPGINAAQLQAFLEGNQFFGLLNLFSGGGFSTLSIVMIGLSPYITASIVMQLMTILIPRLKEMYQEEGDSGRQRFMQYSRYLTVPPAFIQAFGFLLLLQQQ